MAKSGPLRLLAEDADDLQVIAAALQDAVARLGDFTFDPKRRAFTVELNRYRWEERGRGRGERVRAALKFDGVLAARRKGLGRDDPETVASLLNIAFDPGEPAPSGVARLVFAGGGEIALDVECLEATLVDVSPAWPARARPRHGD